MLEVKGLSFSYVRGVQVLRDIDLSLGKGQILSIIGANGAGKSTLFNCIAGLLNYQQGSIKIGGQDIKKKSRIWLAKHLALVGQVDHSNHNFSVRDYLLTGRNPYISFGQVPKESDHDLVEKIAHDLQLGDLTDKIFNQLSGGQRQRIRIARALVQETDIILLDEPTNHLDFRNQYLVMAMIKELRDQGKTIVLTTHSPDIAATLGGQLGIVTKEGGFYMGDQADLLSEDVLYATYGVPVREIFVDELDRNIFAIDWKEDSRGD